uniref:Transmembrane protein 253-like n=1 Tax=Stegastes partitus TaxID=144197 RepID=A0A3B5BLL1_9TELE
VPMTQNMFQEGLYQVFFKEAPPTRPGTQAANDGELSNARIHSWFGTVVNTRLLVSGVIQVLSALACILSTISHACVSYECSVSMMMPVWSSIFYLAAGCLAMEVQRKASKVKVITVSHSSVWILCPAGEQATTITFTVQCFLASVYISFLSWRGLRRYSSPHVQAYSRVSQDPEDTNGPLLENMEHNL